MSDTAAITTPDPEPGLYITIRLEHVTKGESPKYPFREETSIEVLADATEQRFSPFVMASMLRALADEVEPKRTKSVPF